MRTVLFVLLGGGEDSCVVCGRDAVSPERMKNSATARN
jgi:hypothetical protein